MALATHFPPLKDRRLGIDQLPPGLILRNVLQGHHGKIGRLAWSPNGRRLASPSFDRTIRIWDPQTAQPFQRLEGHDQFVTGVSWSPDGKRLASSSDDGTVRIWDVHAQTPLGPPLRHPKIVTGVAWSPDGQLIASSSDDKIVRLWDAQSGKLRELAGHTDRVLSVAWSPEEPVLASASWEGTVRRWHGQTGEEILPILSHSLTKIFHCAWSPDGSKIASAGFDETVRVWDRTGKPLRLLEDLLTSVLAVSFSSDGKYLSAKSLDGTVTIWRCLDWKAVRFQTSPGEWPYTNLAFHPTDPTLAVLGQLDKSVYLFDLDFAKLFGEPVPGPDSLFISYSHHDEKWLQEIQNCLKPLTRSRKIVTWSDRNIPPGAQWEKEIESALRSASVALLLVTQSFLASDFIMERELPFLMEAHHTRGLRLLWVAVSPSLYEVTPLQKYQALNNPLQPLATLEESKRGEEIITICRKIKAALETE